MSEANQALQAQCKGQWERCFYTSNTLMVWLRTLRIIRVAFVVIPIVFGALASWEILKGNNRYEYITATMALIAGLVPAIYAALKLDEHLPTATRLAGEYKNLEIVFADLGMVGPHKPFDVFETEYKRRAPVSKQPTARPTHRLSGASGGLERKSKRVITPSVPTHRHPPNEKGTFFRGARSV